jgi:hypothetical protein
VVAELVGQLEDVPEQRSLGDHVAGVGYLVQLQARRAEHFLREAVHLCLDRLFLRGEVLVQFEVCGHRVLRGWACGHYNSG